ncbi:auxin-induced protein 6B-like [Amaranthus tricolor]|uniref:auxin-induced protein 6B-like n=1 Tax=Amaranthus tricolor TaxID=29722 RepID=UPI00258DD269|nr:auxin-induced protein 6B-like [Amaranthus tricolor]
MSVAGGNGFPKRNTIRHIVRLHQMLRRWRNKAAQRRIPSDVPSGHLAVTVGSNGRRFIVRATYLNHPVFRKLLVQAEEEYGFSNQTGPLSIPCDENVFEEILRFMNRSDSTARFVNLEDFQRSNHCHVGFQSSLTDSRPLLEKSVW